MTLAIELAAVHGCTLFVRQIENQQSAAGERHMLRHYHKIISRIEEYAFSECPFLARFDDQRAESVTIAGCMVFVTLQYAWELFGIDLADEYPRLRVFYDAFKSRRSDVISEGTGQPQLAVVTKK